MLRYMACLRFWALYNVMVPCQAVVWDKFKTAKPPTKESGGGRDRAAEDGVRLVRARGYSRDPKARALSFFSYAALMHAESLVGLFFYMSGHH